MAKYKAVQIYKPSSSGCGYDLDEAEIIRIFCQEDVAKKPVAIYSVAGAFRTGKSFVLNLFLQYLHAGRSEAWLQNKTEKLTEGFGWRGGDDPCTKGIWLWNEPFRLVTEKNEEIVIFLLDTQGTFDHDSDLSECTSIFSLSTLISSYQMFNIFRNIGEESLQFLQMLTEYGHLTYQALKDQSNKPFQNLLFFVRDYHNPKLNGFVGGEKYLKRLLNEDGKKEQLRMVRENITRSFDKVECFLCPSPGEKVAVRSEDSPSISLEDISDKFLDHINCLAQHLFKDNIRPKLINGKICTGNSIIEIINGFGKMFTQGKVPKVKDIIEANADLVLRSTLDQCRDNYVAKMTKACEQECLFPEELKKLHKKMKKNAVNEFEKAPKFSQSRNFHKYLKDLEAVIEQHYLFVEQSCEVKKEKIKSDVRDLQAETEAKYSSRLEKIREQLDYDDSAFEKAEEEIYRQTLAEFTNLAQRYDSRLVDPYLERLIEAMKTILDKHKETAKHIKINIQREISDLLLRADELYRKKMEQDCKGKFLEDEIFEQAHQEAEEAAFRHFDTEDVYQEKAYRQQKKNELTARIEDLKKKFKNENIQNMKLQDFEILNAVTSLMKMYKELLSKVFDQGYMSEDFLKEKHEEALLKVEFELKNIENENGCWLANKCRETLESDINETYRHFQKKNKSEEVLLRDKLESDLKSILDRFEISFEEARNAHFLDENELQKKNEIITDNAGNKFEEAMSGYDSEFVLPLRTKLNNSLKAICDRNKDLAHQQKAEIQRKLSNLVIESKETFCKQMDQKCNGKFTESSELEVIYNQAKNNALAHFNLTTFGEVPEMRKQSEDNLVGDMQTIMDQYRRSNQINQDLHKRDLLKTVQRAVDAYQTSMDKVCFNNYISDEDIAEHHIVSEERAKVTLQHDTRQEGKISFDECKHKLNGMIEESLQKYQASNERKKAKECNKYENEVEETLNNYIEKLKKYRNFPNFNEEALIQFEETSKNFALDEFRKATKRYNSYFYDEYRNQLKKKMSKEEEIHNESLEELKGRLRKKLSRLTADSIVKYRELMDKGCNNVALDKASFDYLHDRTYKKVLFEFDADESVGVKGLKSEEKLRLVQYLDSVKEEYEYENNQNKKLAEGRQLDIIAKAKKSYKEELIQCLRSGYVQDDTLENASCKAKDQIEAQIENQTENETPQYRENCLEKFQRKTNEILMEVKTVNGSLKVKAVNEMQGKYLQHRKEYQEHMKEFESEYIPSPMLKKKHSTFKEMSLNKYGTNPSAPEDEWREQKKKLETAIEDSFKLLCEKNAQNHKNQKDKANREVLNSTSKYLSKLKKAYDNGTYEVLKKEHVKVENEILKEFKKKFPYFEDDEAELTKKLQETFKRYDKSCIIL